MNTNKPARTGLTLTSRARAMRLFAFCLGLALLPGSINAAVRPVLELQSTDVAPIIDGRLDDACWARAAVIRDFRQVEPRRDELPTEATEVRVTYDADHLYIAFRCDDHAPTEIRASQMQHDGDNNSDDLVRFVLDTFHRESDGYFFEVSAAGGRTEGIVENKTEVREEWDAIWRAVSRIGATGWTAEMAIPFKSLAFDPAGSAWGFDVERVIRRKQEIIRWSGRSQARPVTSLPDLGEISGLHGLRQGRGVDFAPYASATYASRGAPSGDGRFQLKPGFDLAWHITPALAATLTVNTDFAETEADERKINLTRFSLSLPEKRAFFLQDAALFSFGSSEEPPFGFYSRRIGLAPDRMPVDIQAGVKIAGRLGRVSLAALDLQVAATGSLAAKNLFVARTKVQVLAESSAGLIVTRGDPSVPGGNTTIGADFNYHTSQLAGGRALDLQAWALASDSDATGRGTAAALQLVYPNEPFDGSFYLGRYGERFDPGLGFAPRTGIYELKGMLGWTWRPAQGRWRQFRVEIKPELVADLAGRLESVDFNLPELEWKTNAGGKFKLEHAAFLERLDGPYEIADGVVIAPGTYRWERGEFELTTSSARPLGLALKVKDGGFYTGHRRDYEGTLTWRASRHFFASLDGKMSDIRLATGGFTTWVARFQAKYLFSPDLTLNALTQYDSKSRTLGLNVRLKWTVQPGNELFLVWNQGYAEENEHWRPTSTQLTTKAAWTLRF